MAGKMEESVIIRCSESPLMGGVVLHSLEFPLPVTIERVNPPIAAAGTDTVLPRCCTLGSAVSSVASLVRLVRVASPPSTSLSLSDVSSHSGSLQPASAAFCLTSASVQSGSSSSSCPS
jgi:hypothetical protein